jgi:inner membrane protein
LLLHLQTGANTPHSASLELTPKVSTDQFKNAFNATLPEWISAPDANGVPAQTPLELSATIRLKGSGDLLFFPGGRETTISASSSWSSPSFTGSMLPDVRTVKDSGFAADWKVLAINRKFPQQWKKATYNLSDSPFGVDLFVPVDAYQQITRTVKYALLIIVLTFTAFLLIEWICHLVIHVFQYILVGFALCIFYTLLLSLSEYLGFSPAYFLAAAATIGLIAWYMGSLLHSWKLSLFVAFLLTVQYGFLYTLIQLEDYALLMGSIGLFVILALVMYFSRKINWEQKSPAPEAGTLAQEFQE